MFIRPRKRYKRYIAQKPQPAGDGSYRYICVNCGALYGWAGKTLTCSKPCARERLLKHKQAASAKSYAENPAPQKAATRKWQTENPERARAAQKIANQKALAANPQRYRDVTRAYVAANPDLIKWHRQKKRKMLRVASAIYGELKWKNNGKALFPGVKDKQRATLQMCKALGIKITGDEDYDSRFDFSDLGPHNQGLHQGDAEGSLRSLPEGSARNP